MRVYIYKAKRGLQDVLFRPARRTGLPLLLRQGLTPETRKEAIAEELGAFDRQREVREDEIPF